ncbi:sulfurtransferase TusA family protein [Marinicella meishanensis]|uniref:sulfurtransferase TusA family protein n=1 Tax=Marinicella meishanensis TaxID=2873263 RepID=UPI001CC10EB7|nr:sulfurtransferase TusA family protein [Marinicella sp. NBU2979]
MNDPSNTPLIDATGLLCPQPLSMLKQAVKPLSAGAVVHITVTDPHAELDFAIWCERFGHGLEKISEASDQWVFAVVVDAGEAAS